jgi:hypothetical protein
METPEETNDQKPPVPPSKTDPSLEFIWGQFNMWSVTSREIKSTLTKWRWRVFIFVVLGALLGIVSSEFAYGNWGKSFDNILIAEIIGAFSGVFIALAAYAGSEILTEELEKTWLRARSAAEAYKSEAYMYLLKAPPYSEATAVKRVFQRSEKLMRAMADVPATSITREEAIKRLPPTSFTIDQYVEKRVKEQAYDYYLPKSREYQKILKRAKNISYILGFSGVILGTMAATGILGVSVWIAFISAASASIATYISSNQYQYLSVTFQATANRLLLMSTRWHSVRNADIKEQRAFVKECEAVISLENSAWVAEMVNNDDQ